MDTNTNRELTFGEKLVGLSFNPSGDEKVNRAKVLCAELADLVNNVEPIVAAKPLEIQKILRSHALGEILNAQMCTVKLLTLKY